MSIRINKKANLLKVGDKVTSDFYPDEAHLIRNITSIYGDTDCGSGRRASVSGGIPCKLCKVSPGRMIRGVDAAWFIPVAQQEKEREV